MANRVKCIRCENQILETTALRNNGLCAACKSDAKKAEFDAVVQSWIDNPLSLPGTHGIPEPEDFALALAASQLRSRLYPDADAKAENACRQFFDEAHDKWYELGSAGLSQKEKHVLAIETFYGEVTNGGLQQYLDNESGAFADWAVDAFAAIGLPVFADVMRNVRALFPSGAIPEDSEARSEQVEAIDSERLEAIEQPFWDRYQTDRREIRRRLFDYISR